MKYILADFDNQYYAILNKGNVERIFTTLSLEYDYKDLSDETRYKLSRQIRTLLIGQKYTMEKLGEYLVHFWPNHFIGWCLFGKWLNLDSPPENDYSKEFKLLNDKYLYFEDYSVMQKQYELTYKIAAYYSTVCECSYTRFSVGENAYKLCILFGDKADMKQAIDSINVNDVTRYDNDLAFLNTMTIPAYRTFSLSGTPRFNLNVWRALLPSFGKLVVSQFENAPYFPTQFYTLSRHPIKPTYHRYHENEALAFLCKKHNHNEYSFNQALDMLNAEGIKNQKEDALPNVFIDISKIDPLLTNHYLVKLPKKDIHLFELGDILDRKYCIKGHNEFALVDSLRYKTNGFYVLVKLSKSIKSDANLWSTFDQDGNKIVGLLYVGYTLRRQLLIDDIIAPCLNSEASYIELLLQFATEFQRAATYAQYDRLMLSYVDQSFCELLPHTPIQERFEYGTNLYHTEQYELFCSKNFLDLRSKVAQQHPEIDAGYIASAEIANKILSWDEKQLQSYTAKYGPFKDIQKQFVLSLKAGKIQDLRYLYSLGGDIESYYSDSGLGHAAASGHLEIVKFLLSINATQKNILGTVIEGKPQYNPAASYWVTIRLFSGEPVKKAIEGNHLEILLCLIRAGFSITQRHVNSLLPLATRAAEIGDLEAVKCLKKVGKDLDTKIVGAAQRKNHDHITLFMKGLNSIELSARLNLTFQNTSDFFTQSFIYFDALRCFATFALVNKASHLKQCISILGLCEDVTKILLIDILSLPHQSALIKVWNVFRHPELEWIKFNIDISEEARKDLTYRYYFQDSTPENALGFGS